MNPWEETLKFDDEGDFDGDDDNGDWDDDDDDGDFDDDSDVDENN